MSALLHPGLDRRGHFVAVYSILGIHGVILAQGPCSSSLYRTIFNTCPKEGEDSIASKSSKIV